MIVQPGYAGGHQADLRRGVTHEWRGKWEPVEQSPDAQRDSGTEVQEKKKKKKKKEEEEEKRECQAMLAGSDVGSDWTEKKASENQWQEAGLAEVVPA